MKWYDGVSAGIVAFALGAAAYAWVAPKLVERPQAAPENRVRYPGEEEIARSMCKPHRLLYWWLADLRLTRAEMHVRCTGVVTVVRDVEFK